MSTHMTPDEQLAEEAIRGAFPLDAGLSAEKTRRLHAHLKGFAPARKRAFRLGPEYIAVAAAALAIAVGGIAVYATRPEPIPEPNLADRYEAAYPKEAPYRAPKASGTAIPALALRAISPAGGVLHFTSVADTAFGPSVGKSSEEMWFEPKTGAGRLVRENHDGKRIIQKETIVSDGSGASMMTEVPGQQPSIERVELTGRLGKSFDKLAAYRRMLESGTATVTARGKVDGDETYRLRAEIEGFGDDELVMVMEAEIRAKDYLPISYRSGFEKADGTFLLLRTRSFSRFETVDVDELPADWFTPAKTTPRGGARRTSAEVDI